MLFIAAIFEPILKVEIGVPKNAIQKQITVDTWKIDCKVVMIILTTTIDAV